MNEATLLALLLLFGAKWKARVLYLLLLWWRLLENVSTEATPTTIKGGYKASTCGQHTYLHILPYLGDCGHRANETKSRPRVGQSVAARGAVEWKCKWLQKHKYFRRWQVLSHIATRQFAQSVCGSKLNVLQQQSWGEMDGWLWPLCWNRLMEMQWRGFNGKLNSSLDISAFLLGLEDNFHIFYLWITGHWVHANISKSRFDGKSKDKKIPRTFSGDSESKETNRRGLNNKTNP